MTRKQALSYVSFAIDDSLSADHSIADIGLNDVLVGWQDGFEPLFVAVRSYLPGVILTKEEAAEVAEDYLTERKWFSDEPREADYVIGGL